MTVAAYEVGGSQVLVPQRIEPARRVRELSDAQVNARQSGTVYPGSAEFRATVLSFPPRGVICWCAWLTGRTRWKEMAWVKLVTGKWFTCSRISVSSSTGGSPSWLVQAAAAGASVGASTQRLRYARHFRRAGGAGARRRCPLHAARAEPVQDRLKVSLEDLPRAGATVGR